MKINTGFIAATTLIIVAAGVGIFLLRKKKPLQQIGGTPPTPPYAPPYTPPVSTPDPVATTPTTPTAPKLSASELYDRKIEGAAGMLYEALDGVDYSGAGEEQFWSVTRSLDKDEREDVADVYDDDWGDLCKDIEGDFSGDDEVRALKKYGYPSGNYIFSNCD